jgi:PAP2 superfamily
VSLQSKDDHRHPGIDTPGWPFEKTLFVLPSALYVRRLGKAVAHILHTQAWFIGICLIYIAAAVTVAAIYDQSVRFGIYGKVQLAFFLNLAVVSIVCRIGWILIHERPPRPLRPVWRDLTGKFALGRRIALAVPALVLLPLALSAYTSMKTMIPTIAPFAWDVRLSGFDSNLHGGTAPWTLLQPLLGTPTATGWLDWAYGPLWFWLLLILQFWQTFSLHAERTRFLIAFILSWALLGTVMAIVFSSAGPVYYAAVVVGPDPFAPLLAHLDGMAESVPVLARQAQTVLWQNYILGDVRLAAGISAMPSMHLSMGTLMVLATWRLGPIARVISCLYLVVLLIGSVYLAWHYAVDGYVAIVGTWAIWWTVGRAIELRNQFIQPNSTLTVTDKRP